LTDYKTIFSLNAGTFSTKQTLEEQFLIYYNQYNYCVFRFMFNVNNSDFIASTNYIAVMHRIDTKTTRAVYVLYGGALVEYFYYVKLQDSNLYYSKISGTRII
jgi:hypothetical protein